jgi:signal peptidase I
MGDNRNHSNDSRDDRIGFVDVRSIMGKVYLTVYPLKHFGSVYSG